jgi:hypothetical protein
MTIETVLLILESVLLAVTIILLLYSIREGRDRRNLLLEVGKATKILTRQEYFLTVTDSMMDAGVEKEATKKGYRIPSEGLAAILKDHFSRCWSESAIYEEYVKEIIRQTGVTLKQLGRELQIDEKELEGLSKG